MTDLVLSKSTPPDTTPPSPEIPALEGLPQGDELHAFLEELSWKSIEFAIAQQDDFSAAPDVSVRFAAVLHQLLMARAAERQALDLIERWNGLHPESRYALTAAQAQWLSAAVEEGTRILRRHLDGQ